MFLTSLISLRGALNNSINSVIIEILLKMKIITLNVCYINQNQDSLAIKIFINYF